MVSVEYVGVACIVFLACEACISLDGGLSADSSVVYHSPCVGIYQGHGPPEDHGSLAVCENLYLRACAAIVFELFIYKIYLARQSTRGGLNDADFVAYYLKYIANVVCWVYALNRLGSGISDGGRNGS